MSERGEGRHNTQPYGQSQLLAKSVSTSQHSTSSLKLLFESCSDWTQFLRRVVYIWWIDLGFLKFTILFLKKEIIQNVMFVWTFQKQSVDVEIRLS